MKVALVVHGFPPELSGGTENTTLALARGLAARGHRVSVIAGSMDWEAGLRISEDRMQDPESGASFEVFRIHRCDAYFDHWQKAEQPLVGRLFDELLERFGPDVVHVQHWIRLTNDLVVRAARRGIPSVVTLNDLWSSCLVAFRVRPDLRRFCEVPLGPEPCLSCAGHVPPRPAWQASEEGADLVRAFRTAAQRELELARVLIAPSRVHGEASLGWLGLELEDKLEVVPPPRESSLAAGACAVQVPDRVTAGEPLVLGSFGHWSELKGTDLLIEALGLVREPERFRLLLAGSAPAPEFAARVEQLAASSPARVELLGAYKPDELGSHPVARAALFVSGSRAHESFGLVVDEALELGRGQLLPDLGALGERAREAAWAESYRSSDARDLARLLDDLADDPARVRALARAATEAVAHDDRTARAWPLDAHIARTLELYERALSAGPPEAHRIPSLDPAQEAERLAAIEAWDQALGATDPKELGLA